jgi:hypothetical protein
MAKMISRRALTEYPKSLAPASAKELSPHGTHGVVGPLAVMRGAHSDDMDDGCPRSFGKPPSHSFTRKTPRSYD